VEWIERKPFQRLALLDQKAVETADGNLTPATPG
jgi:hypothetical protein